MRQLRTGMLKFVSVIAFLGAAIAPSNAATITRNFLEGSAPNSSVGGGNLIEIFNTAADYWESTIQDDFSASISFGWADLADTTLGETLPLETTENRALKGEILFNRNTNFFNWFLDSTPQVSEEFNEFQSISADLGSGAINVGRVYSSPIADAAGSFDLLTIAIHEIGHIFGILNFYEAFDSETLDDDIDVTSPIALTGSAIPTTPINGGHINLESAAMYPFFNPGQRKLLSEADILAIATTTSATQFNLNPQLKPKKTPENSTLLTYALFAIFAVARRRSKQTEISNMQSKCLF